MRYEYALTKVPADPSGYRLTALTEGELCVRLGRTTFLDAGGILLVEFGVVLYKWLLLVQQKGLQDLYYASMDFEEEPIFRLRYDKERGQFEPESVWASSAPTLVSPKEAMNAAESYVHQLGMELKVRYSIELDRVLQEAVADDN
jgi:hypothetical protein